MALKSNFAGAEETTFHTRDACLAATRLLIEAGAAEKFRPIHIVLSTGPKRGERLGPGDADLQAARLARVAVCVALTAVAVIAWKLASATSPACLAALLTLS